MKRAGRIFALLALVFGSTEALAQTQLEGGFDPDIFHPASGSEALIVSDRPRLGAPNTLKVGIMGGFAQDLLRVCKTAACSGDEYGSVVQARGTGWALFSFSTRFGEAGLALPFSVFNRSDFDAVPDRDLSSTALGDLRISYKYGFLGDRKFGAGVKLAASLPTGKTEDYLGGPGAGLEGHVLADVDLGRAIIAVSGGFRHNTDEAQLSNLIIQDSVVYSGGVEVPVLAKKLSVIGEAHGSVGVGSDSSGEIVNPFEALGGLRFRFGDAWSGLAGAGAGIGNGYGSPAFRAFFGLSYQRAGESRAAVGHGVIIAKVDPEPEPHVVEAPDPDQDGIRGDLDMCPDEPEDIDGEKDDDGCPDADDGDKDGILGAADKCPDKAEDADGFQDDDGCPDDDDDGDGIRGDMDLCPDKPEDVDGEDDNDGCPDLGAVVTTTGSLEEIDERIPFERNKARLLPESFAMIEKIAKLLESNPQIKLLSIEGHTDDLGTGDFNLKLSRSRANAVRKRLVGFHKVDPKRLKIVGHGDKHPRFEVVGDDEDTRAKNRRVEFVIVSRE